MIPSICEFLSTEEKTRVFSAFVEMLRWFAGHQIRNVAVSNKHNDHYFRLC